MPAGGTNTNLLLQALDHELRRDFQAMGVRIKARTFAGVYPTYSFNAQARAEDNGYLILVDTGCFETIEAAVAIVLRGWTQDQKTALLVGVIRDYWHHRKLPRAEDLADTPSEEKSALEIVEELDRAEKLTPILTNACDRFVIAHEYGHVVRGHLGGSRPQTRLGAARELEVIATDREKEFEADLWALHTLIRQSDNYDARLRLLTYTGALIPLGISLLIEDCRKADAGSRVPEDYHPPALERMRLLQTFYERLNWTLDYKGSGRLDASLLRLVSDASRVLGGEGLPLVKSRSLESLKDPSEEGLKLAAAFGVPHSGRERIQSDEVTNELLARLIKRTKLKLTAPTKTGLGGAIDLAFKIQRVIVWGLVLLGVLVLLALYFWLF